MRKMPGLLVGIVFLVVGQGLAATESAPGFPYDKPGTDIGAEIRARDKRFEPSGIAYHPGRKTLFVVCDNGPLAEITPEGRLVNFWESRYLDREAVAYCCVTGTIFVWNNSRKRIEEFDPARGEYVRRFDASAIVGTKKDESNTEALTFIPEPDDPEGGYFLLGQKGRRIVHRLRLSIRSGGERIELLGTFDLPPSKRRIRDGRMPLLSDLYYDPGERLLYALFSPGSTLAVMTLDGRLVGEWAPVPASAPEGICLDADGNLYIAEDNRGRDRSRPIRNEETGAVTYPQFQGWVLRFGKARIDFAAPATATEAETNVTEGQPTEGERP